MPWFRVDDTFSDHPKVDELSLSAVGLWTLAGSWSARNLTDGHVTSARVRKFGGTSAEVTELVEADLWIEDGNGWRFKSWDEYQPTKDSVEKERAAARKRMHDMRSKRKNPGPTSENVRANTSERTENEQRSYGGSSPAPTLPIPTHPKEKKTSSSEAAVAPLRPEVEALCRKLADRIEGNGAKRPTIGKTWHNAARLMIDTDGRTPDQISRMIDWCQSDGFWRSNILSMPKLREKYDQMKLRAEAETLPTLSKTERELAAWRASAPGALEITR